MSPLKQTFAARFLKHTALSLSLVGAVAAPAVADSAEDWLKEIKPDVSIRYRVAVIDEAGFDRTAVASTLQTLVGVKTGEAFGISGYVQFRNVTNVFTDRFNDTINGRTDFPVEADPEATELD